MSILSIRLRRVMTIAATALAVAAVPTYAPAASSHGGSAVPAAAAAGTLPQLLDLLAGSPSYLVYVEAGLLPAGGHVEGAPVSKARTTLFARSRDGKVMNLGRPPANLQPRMSISGSILTGVKGQALVGDTERPYWWKLGTHRHGRLTVPAGASYLAASPDGAVMSVGDELVDVTTTGKVRHWGKPFPSPGLLRAVSDDHGVVVFTTPRDATPSPTTFAYMRFAAPGEFTPLGYSTTDAIYCADLDKVVVGCHTENEDGGVIGTELIPLDGSTATTTTRGALTLGLIGDTAIWDGGRGRLESISLGATEVWQGPKSMTPQRYFTDISGTDPYPSIRQFGLPLVAALGKVAIAQDASQHVALVSSVSQGKRLFTVPRSRAAVSAFGLTAHRAVYAGDTRVPHHGGRFSTYNVAIRHSSGHAGFGTPRLLHAKSDYVLAGVSKQLRVYAVHHGQEHADLKVRYRGETRTISHIPFDSYLSVSGTRVMYAAQRALTGGPTAVYDAATGKTKRVDTDAACCDRFQGRYGDRTPALSGANVFYLKADGSLWQHNLRSGREKRLAAPAPHRLVGGVVYAAGNRVAWTLMTGGFNHPSMHSSVRRLDVPGARIHSVPDRVVGVSSAGVLTMDGTLSYRQGRIGPTASFTWRPFTDKARKVLSKRDVFLLPKLAGHTMAWVDTAGRLRVKDL